MTEPDHQSWLDAAGDLGWEGMALLALVVAVFVLARRLVSELGDVVQRSRHPG